MSQTALEKNIMENKWMNIVRCENKQMQVLTHTQNAQIDAVFVSASRKKSTDRPLDTFFFFNSTKMVRLLEVHISFCSLHIHTYWWVGSEWAAVRKRRVAMKGTPRWYSSLSSAKPCKSIESSDFCSITSSNGQHKVDYNCEEEWNV